MKCPHCGYILDAFDLTCPRCQRKPVENSKPASAPEKPAVVVWQLEGDEPPQQAPGQHKREQGQDWSGGFNQSSTNSQGNQDAFTSSPDITPLMPSPVPSRYSPSGEVVCPCCRGIQVQKVSAIVRAGSWSSDTNWATNGKFDANTTGVNMGTINGPHLHADTFGVSGAHTTGRITQNGHESTLGATALAKALAPPASPPRPVKRRISEKAALWFMGLPFFFYVFWRAGMNGWQCWTVIIGTLLVWCLTLTTNASQFQRKTQEFPRLNDRWQKKFETWNSLFYCHRCDRVFHPATGRSSSVSDMNALL